MALAQRIAARARDIGGFSVRRLLPHARARAVGPFVFFDEMGPARFAPGQGITVRPHPHIGLATVSYLFEGAMMHRDSLGVVQRIAPGAVNLMTAGRGIVHSERGDPEVVPHGHAFHGIQIWLALPRELEECEPAFAHTPAADLPEMTLGGGRLRLIMGAYGEARSPVEAAGEPFYAELRLKAGARFDLPEAVAERAVYLVAGRAAVAGEALEPGTMAVLEPGPAALEATEDSHLMIAGGASLDGPRHIWWNFVSSRKDRIAAAQAEWTASAKKGFRDSVFTLPPGETEHIPAPDEHKGPPPPTKECMTS